LSSTFTRYLSQVARIESAVQVFREQRCLSQEFAIDIRDTAFTDITVLRTFGGAFYAISEIHTLSVTNSRFIECHTQGSGQIGNRLNDVGGGAFVFSGARANVEATLFVRCSAVSNTQTMHSYILHLGANKVMQCLFARNGNAWTRGHSLFCLDNGAADLKANNITRNNVIGGYAGGHIGWFSCSARVMFTNSEWNVGKSIFGMCSYSATKPDSEILLVTFFHNYATKYGVFMRHTALTTMRSACFFENIGNVFYGNAPIIIHTSTFDCPRPSGPIDEDTVSWNFRLGVKTWHLKVPSSVKGLGYVGEVNGETLLAQRDGDVEDQFAAVAARKQTEKKFSRVVFNTPAPPKEPSLEDILRDSTVPRRKRRWQPLRLPHTRVVGEPGQLPPAAQPEKRPGFDIPQKAGQDIVQQPGFAPQRPPENVPPKPPENLFPKPGENVPPKLPENLFPKPPENLPPKPPDGFLRKKAQPPEFLPQNPPDNDPQKPIENILQKPPERVADNVLLQRPLPAFIPQKPPENIPPQPPELAVPEKKHRPDLFLYKQGHNITGAQPAALPTRLPNHHRH
jgi:hypothetical protein